MKKQLNKRIYFLVVSLLLTISSFAQEIPEEDDTRDVPIDNWIPFMVLLAIGLVYYYTTKRKTITE